MTDIIDRNDGRPDDLLDMRENPSLTVSKLVWAGNVRVDSLRRMLGDVADTARAVAVAVFLILAVGLTRPIRDLSRNRLFAGIASRTGDGAQPRVEIV